jgi:HPt (histidine-containing phosphotransfer) domain-containing protein
MTADAVMGVEEKCSSHGIHYYVSKPFEPEAFIRTILGALKGKPCRESTAPYPIAGGDMPTDMAGEPANVQKTQATHESNDMKDAMPQEGAALDSAGAIRRLGIDAGIYVAILQAYLSENEHTGKELQAQIDAKDFATAAQTVHKLKSSSASVGASSLSACAERLQKALQSNEKDSIYIENALLQDLLSQVMREMQAFQESQSVNKGQ